MGIEGKRYSSRLVNVPSDGRGLLLPEGAGMLPDGTPDGTGKLEGAGMLPEGMGMLPEGTGMLPDGILDGLPDG